MLNCLHDEKIIDQMEIHLSGESGELNSFTLSALPAAVKRIILPRQTDIQTLPELIDQHAFEAFLLNEKCQFNGAYCQSLHCDEMRHLCLVNYQMEYPIKRTDFYDSDCIGLSGCGLCSLYRLVESGVTYYKIVIRGNYQEATIRDIQAVKKAFTLVKEARDEKDYIKRLKQELCQLLGYK